MAQKCVVALLLLFVPSSSTSSSPASATDVPISIELGGVTPSTLREAYVTMCRVDWAKTKSDPPAFPMFKDVLAGSGGCEGPPTSSSSPRAVGQTRRTTFGELEDEYEARRCGKAGAGGGCAPSGLVFHQSRCGSTALANALSALPHSVAYSESPVPLSVIAARGLDAQAKVRALRVMVAAMGRPIHASSPSSSSSSSSSAAPPAPLAEGSSDEEVRAALAAVGGDGWAPTDLYLKLQSVQSLHIRLWREAFPSVPWAFVHRSGTEVLASLFRGLPSSPAPDAAPTLSVAGDGASVSHLDNRLRAIPCLRTAGDVAAMSAGAASGRSRPAPPAWVQLMSSISASASATPGGAESASEEDPLLRLMSLAPEAYCAVQTGAFAATALHEGIASRVLALRALQRSAAGVDEAKDAGPLDSEDAADALLRSAVSGPAFAAALAGFAGGAGEGRGDEVAHGVGVVGGVGLGIAIDYALLRAAAEPAGKVGSKRPGGGDAASRGAQDPSVEATGVAMLRTHFGIPLPRALAAELSRVAQRYSKSRVKAEDAAAMTAAGGGALRGGKGGGAGWAGPSRAAPFVDDSEDKQAAAWPLLRLSAARYMQPFRSALHAFSGTQLPEGDEDATTAAALEAVMVPGSAGDDAVETGAGAGDEVLQLEALPRRVPLPSPAPSLLLPLGDGYPALFPLTDVLSYWSADIVTPPVDYGQFSSLRVFDWRVEAERAEAERYRRAEVPFVVRHVPALDATAAKWASDADLLAQMGGPDAMYTAEVNVAGSNHFMYWNKAKARRDTSYRPPTSEAHVKAGEWVQRAHATEAKVREEERAQLPKWWFGESEAEARDEAEAQSVRTERGKGAKAAAAAEPHLPPLPPTRAERELWYMRASTNQADAKENAWVHEALTFVSPAGSTGDSDPARPFFLIDDKQQRGIHCRFGIPGIIAEAHYDAGRNFITMERGRKRYVLSPPSECGNLGLMRDGPSARHSSLDWSDPAAWPVETPLRSALGLEVILEAGDALYVPALWFHYIVSLDLNIQCNTRSGTPPLYAEELAACGFPNAPVTERLGDHTDLKARELQPDRRKHMGAWWPLWPATSLDGSLGPTSTAAADAAAGAGRIRREGPISYAAQVQASVLAAMRRTEGGGAAADASAQAVGNTDESGGREQLDGGADEGGAGGERLLLKPLVTAALHSLAGGGGGSGPKSGALIPTDLGRSEIESALLRLSAAKPSSGRDAAGRSALGGRTRSSSIASSTALSSSSSSLTGAVLGARLPPGASAGLIRAQQQADQAKSLALAVRSGALWIGAATAALVLLAALRALGVCPGRVPGVCGGGGGGAGVAEEGSSAAAATAGAGEDRASGTSSQSGHESESGGGASMRAAGKRR